MNELKPEDVMRALDILDKMDFFQGQRAGRELWNEKPYEVQEQDIADFSQGVATVKKVIEDALALLRDKDAEIERLNKALEELADESDARDIDETYAVSKIRAEAITEFIERAKSQARKMGDLKPFITIEDLERIAKEIRGEQA